MIIAIIIGLVLWYFYQKLEVAINGGSWNIISMWGYLQQDFSWLFKKNRIEWARKDFESDNYIFVNQTSYIKDRGDPIPTNDVLLAYANQMLPSRFIIFFNHIFIPFFPIVIYSLL